MRSFIVCQSQRVDKANDEGKWMPIGGTVQGERGWYQKGDQVAKFIILEGAFELADGPMSYTEWSQEMVREQRAAAAALPGGSRGRSFASTMAEGS